MGDTLRADSNFPRFGARFLPISGWQPMRYFELPSLAVAAVFALSLAGCGDPSIHTCGVPGSVVTCPCIDGGMGIQECQLDGTLGACQCSAGDSGVDTSLDSGDLDVGVEDVADTSLDSGDLDVGVEDVADTDVDADDVADDSDTDDVAEDADADDVAEDADADADRRVAQVIDTAGGTLSLDGVELVFDEGSVDEPVEIVITRLDIGAIDGYDLFTSVYRFEPAGLTFDPPLEVSFEFDGDADRVGVYWTSADDPGVWERLDTTAEGAVATAEVTHFSEGFAGDEVELPCDGSPANECGGCAVLSEALDAPCGDCGMVACDGEDATTCADPGRNLCGGCAVLDGAPTDECGDGGILVCDGVDAVTCGDSSGNACGGEEVLDATPGDGCAECGTVICDGAEATSCDDPGANPCGACSTLEGTPGVPCGPCGVGSEFVCTGDGLGVACEAVDGGGACTPELCDDTTICALIGTDGGTLTLAGATPTFPASAVTEDTTVLFELLPDLPDAGYTPYSGLYRLTTVPALDRFEVPVEVRMPFVGDPADAVLFWGPEFGAAFDRIGGTVDGDAVVAFVESPGLGFAGDGIDYIDPPDTTCVRGQLIEGRTTAPSAVALWYTVDDCDGRPVTGLGADDFVVLEDDATLSAEASVTVLPRDGRQIFVTLVLDVSGSTSESFDELIAGATRVVERLQVDEALPVQIAIELFAGDTASRLLDAHTLATETLTSTLADLATAAEGLDVAATNLNGAIVGALLRVDSARAAFESLNRGGAFTSGTVLVFTDGRDTAGRVTADAVSAAREASTTEVVAVGLDGPDFDLAALTALVDSPVLVAPDAGALEREFEAVATRISGRAARTYLLGYCSPKRSGDHIVSVEVRDATNETTPNFEFAADGFGPGCSATTFADACDGLDCGGLGCGACDHRVARCAEDGLCEECTEEEPCPVSFFDTDGDGIPDEVEGDVDSDGDGLIDRVDPDSDDDGISDFREGVGDFDADGTPNYLDSDSDGDGHIDAVEFGRSAGSDLPPVDTDEDGSPDYLDLDSDDDGLGDEIELGCPESTERTLADSDDDGLTDLLEVAFESGVGEPDPACDPAADVIEGVDRVIVLPFRGEVFDERLDFAWEIDHADVAFNMDTTGSMGGEIGALESSFDSEIVPGLSAWVESIAYSFSQFDDFPCSSYGSGADRPFILRQRMTTDLDAASAGADALERHGGGDYYESGFEAVYQIATGLGRSEADCALGDVPPFDSDLGWSEGVADGAIGGVGFREGSLPIVVHITDAPSHARGDDGYPFGASRDEAFAAMRAIGGRLIGLASGSDARSDLTEAAIRTGSVVPPCAWSDPFDGSRPFACADGLCCTGSSGVGRLPDADGTCPLVYDISSSGAGTAESVIEGVIALLELSMFDVSVHARMDEAEFVASGVDTSEFVASVNLVSATAPDDWCADEPAIADRDADGVNDQFTGVPTGSQLVIDFTVANTTVPGSDTVQVFSLSVDVMGGGAALRTENITILVPPRIGPPSLTCGDGVLDDEEECDDGNEVEDDGCTNSCTLSVCGDGTINERPGVETFESPLVSAFGETGYVCNDGASCSTDSSPAVCDVTVIDNASEHGICQALGYERALEATWGDGLGGDVGPQHRSLNWECVGFDCYESPLASFDGTCPTSEMLASITCEGAEREECDDGEANADSPDTCRTDCTLPFCGDGIGDSDEECDDANLVNDDGCSNGCLLPQCGDGIVNGDEECDDGDDDDANACRNDCRLPTCGDGVVSEFLREENLVAPIVTGPTGATGHVCDDGGSCVGTTCRVFDNGSAPEHGICQALGYDRCVDVTWGGGPGDSDSSMPHAYNWSCSDFVCGLGGSTYDSDNCSGSEMLDSIRCSGGYEEACDEGDANSDAPGATCRADCTLPRCGDGVLDAHLGEECDDGNDVNDDGCSDACLLPVCGDGVVQPGEECDEGDGNADVPGATCRTTCLLPSCGDGIVDSDEECDDANLVNDDGCSNECLLPQCGDGVLNGDEECDDGDDDDADECRNDCLLPACGDGVVQAGEECDDGDEDDTNECRNDCLLPSCGDGSVGGIEECDDGNDVADDGCSNECLLPQCGDGVVNGDEECDDGNDDGFDGCRNDCMLCQPGVHGEGCVWSCWDGIQNGDEEDVDCGGPCEPCDERWLCNYQGEFTGTRIDYAQDGGDGSCDPVSPGVCITRATSGGLFNAVTDTAFDWVDGGPVGTTWRNWLHPYFDESGVFTEGSGRCDGGVETPTTTWHAEAWADPGRLRTLPGKTFCMSDTTTGEDWVITFRTWESGAGTSGAGEFGDFLYTRRQHACECDPGFHGSACQASCSDGEMNGDETGVDCGPSCGGCELACADGVRNGDEDDIDCGGACDPCSDNWQCNYHGTVTETRVDYLHDGSSGSCDAVSPGLCLARDNRHGLYNAMTHDAFVFPGGWWADGLVGTTWSHGACRWDGSDNPTDDIEGLSFRGLQIPRVLVAGTVCMNDSTTGDNWAIEFHSWESGRGLAEDDGGDFSYTRTHKGCECDPGFSGRTCEGSCSDGEMNGDEEGVDCGEACVISCP